MNLKDRVAVITGAASGIGKATAILFAQHGTKIVVWDVNTEAGEAVVNTINSSGGFALFQKVNTANFSEVESAAEALKTQFGNVHILINNAGITRDASLLKMTAEQWQQVMDVNLTGVFNCTKAIAPLMIAGSYGRIINTSSVVGLYGNYGQSNYTAAKAGVVALTKTWARELGKHNITVNAVAPGFIATEMVNTIPEKVLQQFKSKTPLERMGTPQDVAKAYLFLVSDDAAFITATTLSVDGGLVL